MLFLKSVALNPLPLLKTVRYRNGMRKFPTIHGAYPLPSFCPYKGLMDPPPHFCPVAIIIPIIIDEL